MLTGASVGELWGTDATVRAAVVVDDMVSETSVEVAGTVNIQLVVESKQMGGACSPEEERLLDDMEVTEQRIEHVAGRRSEESALASRSHSN